MDNVSKALLMAGGVLIAIAIIGVAVYSYAIGRSFAQSSNDMLTVAEVNSFNRFYNSYKNLNGGKIKIYDAVNILNRAQVDGVKVDSYPASYITRQNGRFDVPSDNPQAYTRDAVIEIVSYDPNGRVTEISLR